MKKIKPNLLILLQLLFVSGVLLTSKAYGQQPHPTPSVASQPPDEIFKFRSSFESFEILRRGSKYYLNNIPIDLGTFKNFLTLFEQKFTDDCSTESSKKPVPDLRVTRIQNDPAGINEATKSFRLFYIDENKVGDGTNCLEISGSAIYYLPLHSSWFNKNETASIHLGNQWSLKRGEENLGSFKKVDKQWTDAEDLQFVDWDFFNRFVKSLEKFKIGTRMHPAILKSKPTLELVTSKGTYELYSFGANSWVLKSPRKGWVVGSTDWGFWQNLGDHLWYDRFQTRLKTLLDKNTPLEERKEILLKLGAFWNNNIQVSFHRLLKDPTENIELRLATLALLKRKPSKENFSVLIEVLQAAKEIELQSELTNALRVRNPRGPVITESDDEESRTLKTQQWMAWWQTQNKPNP